MLLVGLFNALKVGLSSVRAAMSNKSSSTRRHNGLIRHRHLKFMRAPRLFSLLLIGFNKSSTLPPTNADNLRSTNTYILKLGRIQATQSYQEY